MQFIVCVSLVSEESLVYLYMLFDIHAAEVSVEATFPLDKNFFFYSVSPL